jgi:ribosomal protein S18 acetylase RimI-like enzyme
MDPAGRSALVAAAEGGGPVSAPSIDVIRWGRERIRTGPWRGDSHVAFLAPVPDAPLPSADFVRRCLAMLADRGFTRVVTAALSPLEQGGFLAAGFEVEERLHLLGLDLDALPPLPQIGLKRLGWQDRAPVLEVDRASFETFWQFDESGLGEALRATPRTRFRGVSSPGSGERLAGYAICGRSGPRGFVQRLAVHPDFQHHGLGRGLLLDGLYWMRRRRVRRAVVNTQLGNAAALNLYQQIGFRREPSGLSVLAAGLA